MPRTLSYEAIWSGFLGIERLIFMLDFAAWSNIEYDGEPVTTPISLVKEPQEELDARVDAYVAEHKGELVTRRSKCPRCGDEYFVESGYRTCPVERMPLAHVHDTCLPSECSETPALKKCGGLLVDIFRIDESEKVLRERAGQALARQGDIVSRRHVVCAWLVHKFHLGNPVLDEDVRSPLEDVEKHVAEMMEKDVDRLTCELAQLGDPLHLSGRRNLWPTGDTLRRKHSGYLAVRERLISSYNRLVGLTKDHPEFVYLDEEYPRPRKFADPILVSSEQLRLSDDGDSLTRVPDDRATIAEHTRRLERLEDAPAALPSPDTISNRQAAKLYAELTNTDLNPSWIRKLIKNKRLDVQPDGRTTIEAVRESARRIKADAKPNQAASTQQSNDSPSVHWKYTCPRCGEKAPRLVGAEKTCARCFDNRINPEAETDDTPGGYGS